METSQKSDQSAVKTSFDSPNVSPFPSRSPSPTLIGGKNVTDISGGKVNKINNGWTREQEELMAGWADIGACYRWMHDKCEKKMNFNNLWMTVPVIILSTLTGSASFVMNSLVGDNPTSQKYAQIGIGSVSIFTGILTTLGNFFRYAQSSESNRVASIAWGKFQRQVAVELALNPNERIDCSDFLTMCRAELDRLIEQSPPIPEYIIEEFEREFESVPVLKRPDIAHGVEHTKIYKNTDLRLKQIVADATIMIKNKKKALNDILIPEIDRRVEEELHKRLPKLTERLDELEKKQPRQTTTKMPIVVRPKAKQIFETIDQQKEDRDETSIVIEASRNDPNIVHTI